MADTQAQTPAQAQAVAPVPATTADTSGEYPISREARRQAIILLLGVLSIVIFALWTFVTMFDGGITGIEWVSGPLMLAILLVAPLVAWTLLEEANAHIATDNEGITYRTFGSINLRYSWADIAGSKEKDRRGRLSRFFLGDDDEGKSTKQDENVRLGADENEDTSGGDDPETVLLAVRKDPAQQIGNPVVRFLHKQAHGDALPIYGGLENRLTLLQEISSRTSAR